MPQEIFFLCKKCTHYTINHSRAPGEQAHHWVKEEPEREGSAQDGSAVQEDSVRLSAFGSLDTVSV